MSVDYRSALARLLTVLLILGAPMALAREFPGDALRGVVKAFDYPSVRIGDAAYHMTPASKIYNDQNLIIMPSAMPGTAEVMFNLDFNGHIRAIWLLTPEEIAKLGKAKSRPSAPQ